MKTEMIEAICLEMSIKTKNQSQKIKLQSIYFGGGTPSILNESELNLLFESIKQHFELELNVEITLEANPNDLDFQKLETFKKVGINRLSIGIQSFDNRHLKYLHRNHNSQQAKECLIWAKSLDFQNLSLDLIYGIPAPNHDILKQDLATAIKAAVPHISAYSLTIEPKTFFGRNLKNGKMYPIDEDFQAEQMEILIQTLEKEGYEQYEISNFARNEAYSKHNSHYWKKGKYIGVGPSAHSYNGQVRQWNISNNSLYIKALQENTIPFEQEILSQIDHANEYILTSLRTKWGCDLAYLDTAFGIDLRASHATVLGMMSQEDLLLLHQNILYLTPKAKLLADAITEKLMILA